jgi:uncharacterized protein (DUF1778 family)
MDDIDDVRAMEGALMGRLKKRFARSDETIDLRIKEERRASQTEGEKGRRRGPPKLQFNVRATQETRDLIDALADHFGKSLSDVIALAAEALAKGTPDFKRGKS